MIFYSNRLFSSHFSIDFNSIKFIIFKLSTVAPIVTLIYEINEISVIKL